MIYFTVAEPGSTKERSSHVEVSPRVAKWDDLVFIGSGEVGDGDSTL